MRGLHVRVMELTGEIWGGLPVAVVGDKAMPMQSHRTSWPKSKVMGPCSPAIKQSILTEQPSHDCLCRSARLLSDFRRNDSADVRGKIGPVQQVGPGNCGLLSALACGASQQSAAYPNVSRREVDNKCYCEHCGCFESDHMRRALCLQAQVPTFEVL